MGKAYLLLPILFLASTAGARDSDNWSKFQSPEGKFSAAFPGMPSTNLQRLQTRSGRVDMHWHAKRADKEVVYFVAYCDLPPTATQKLNRRLLLDSAETMFANRFKQKLQSKKKVLLRGLQGRELIFGTETGACTALRIYIKDKRLYFAGCAQRSKGSARLSAHRFFSSFSIL